MEQYKIDNLITTLDTLNRKQKVALLRKSFKEDNKDLVKREWWEARKQQCVLLKANIKLLKNDVKMLKMKVKLYGKSL